jgi:capsular polysaccharide biosynthesis protein
MIINRGDYSFVKRAASLRHNGLWIVLGGVVCAIGALFVSMLLPEMYRATTYLLISESKIGASSRDTNLQQMAMLPTFVPFVDNDALIEESLKKLGLDREPYNLTADLFRRRNYLDVRAPKSTRLLELNIEFPDARLATDLANEIAQGAVRFNDKLNASDTIATQEFLKKQLDQARLAQAEAAERRLKAMNEAQIESREKDLAILLAEKDRLSTQLQQLRIELIQNQSRSSSLAGVLAAEPEVVSLKRSITSDRFAEVAARQAFPEGTPLVVTEEAVNETREGLRQTFVNANINGSAQSAGIEAAVKRMTQLNIEIPELVGRVTASRAAIEATNQDYLLAVEATKNASREYQAASTMVSSKSQDIKQIAPALVPLRPIRPKTPINVVMAFLLGVLLCGAYTVGLQRYRELQAETSYVEEDLDVIHASTAHRH